MAPPIIEPVWCVTRLKRSTSTSCRCPATAPTSCRSRRSGAGSARMSPIITVIPPPRISAGEWPLSRSASIRTPAPSPIASGSKITSTLTKKNYASQTRRGLAVLPDALAFALLGAIESLLSAVVADSMSGRRHRSNCELVAQGVANIASALFGGICVTGTIARTATNVRSGAHGPVSGMLHSAYLLLFMLVAAPLIALVPLAVLASVLAIVAWNMAEKHEFIGLVRASMGDRVVLLATFLLTVFVDLTTGIGVGVTLGALIFMHRMAHAVDIETHGHSTLDE